MKVINVLAVDLGASSGRTILGSFDGEKIKLTETHRFSNDPVFVSGHFYWDVLRLFFEIKNGILKTVNGGYGEFSSIGIDTWGVDFGLLDKEGNLLSNPFHYRDARTEGMIERANEIASASFVYGVTGIQSIWFNTLYQLLAMKEKSAELLNQADKLLFMPDLLNYFLTGAKATEYTIASTSQLVDAVKKDWAYEILEGFGFSKALFTDIVPPATIIENVKEDIANEVGISKVPVVAVASHDTASAVASVPFDDSQSNAFISSGTWSLMGMELSAPCLSKKALEYNYTNEGGVFGTIRFLKNIMGLWIIQECRRQWQREGEDLTFAQLEGMAWQAKELECFIDPEDNLFAPPGDMPVRIKQFCKQTGQPVPDGKGEIIRCVAQSLALKYRQTIEGMEDVLDRKINAIHMVGGGIKDKMVCQFTADATCRVVKAGPTEATAAGNVLTQLMALGEIKSIEQGREIIKRSSRLCEYAPQQPEAWDKAFQKFIAICGKPL